MRIKQYKATMNDGKVFEFTIDEDHQRPLWKMMESAKEGSGLLDIGCNTHINLNSVAYLEELE